MRQLRSNPRVTTIVAAIVAAAVSSFVSSFAAGTGTPIQDAPIAARAASGRMPIRIVAGKVVVACDLATDVRRVPANLFIDFERGCGLELHNGICGPQGLAVETRQPPRDVHIVFPDFEIVHAGREHGDQDFLDDFTKYHSHEVGENAVVGTIGSKVLSRYRVVLDLGAGWIELSQPRAPGEAGPRTGASTAADFDVPITLDSDLVWCPVRLPDDRSGVVAIGTGRFDSVVDVLVADDFDAPAGNLASLRLGPLDLCEAVALRPETSTFAHPDGAIGMLGIGFLLHHRVEVDRTNRFASFERTRPLVFPEADFAYFEARQRGEADATEAFVRDHPGARLVGEAARLLVDQRLEEFAGEEDLGRAIEWFCKSFPEDLRCTAALDLMKELLADGSRDAAILAGEKGLESARKDRYPEAPHQVRSRLGQVLYERGDLDRAWRHLLSAAFGVPDDGMVNLYLGRIYEDQGRLERAQSRYIQSVIVAESGTEAMLGLERVSQKLGERGGLSVDTVDRLIAGKVYGFGAATRFEPDADLVPNRGVLLEYFTGAHLDYRAALGGALAFEGLSSHFDRTHVVPITYVQPLVQLTPLCNSLTERTARRRGMEGRVGYVIDGISAAQGAGRQRDAEALYNGARRSILDELTQIVDHEIVVRANFTDGRLQGSVDCDGPSDTDLDLMVILVERGVLFPGKSQVVIHRNVARALLTDRANGIAWGEEDRLSYAFDVALADLETENREWLAAKVAAGASQVVNVGTRMDPRQLSVVAYLVDRSNGEVIQAREERVVSTEEEL